MAYASCIPFVGAIIERHHNGQLQLLLQTRINQNAPQYVGTFEFAAGRMDKPFENAYDAIAREIKEETGLTIKQVIDDSQTDTYSPQKSDASIGFRPFCCVQQLRDGLPWVGFIFRCAVEDGEPMSQETESKDVHWVDASEVKQWFEQSPEKFFTLQLPAWEYYFKEVEA